MEENSIDNNKIEPYLNRKPKYVPYVEPSDAVPSEKGDALRTAPLEDEEIDRQTNKSTPGGDKGEALRTVPLEDEEIDRQTNKSTPREDNDDDPEMRPSSTNEKNKDRKTIGILMPVLAISFVLFVAALVIYYIYAPDRKEGNVFTMHIQV